MVTGSAPGSDLMPSCVPPSSACLPASGCIQLLMFTRSGPIGQSAAGPVRHSRVHRPAPRFPAACQRSTPVAAPASVAGQVWQPLSLSKRLTCVRALMRTCVNLSKRTNFLWFVTRFFSRATNQTDMNSIHHGAVVLKLNYL